MTETSEKRSATNSKYLVVLPWTDLCEASSPYGARVELFWVTATTDRDVRHAVEYLIGNHPLDLIRALGRDVDELQDEDDPLNKEGIVFGEPHFVPITTVPKHIDELPRTERLMHAAANCECCQVVDVLIGPDGVTTCSFTGETLNLMSVPLVMGRRPVLCAICLRDALWVSEKHRIYDLQMLNEAADLRAELADRDRYPDVEQSEKMDLVRLYGELLAKAPDPSNPF
ncbi:MAG: hypothetical protein IPJ65_13600 [Archangiaceae bacterium]|nr:hypothetical protein [Archangiaceae bacterium]